MKVNIGKAISTLLEKNHVVSVSGLGTFKVDNGGKSIGKPPFDAVIFDQEVGEDKSLRDHIALDYDISKNKATRIINVFSSKVLNGVLNYDDVYIQDLGKLYKGKNNALAFLPLDTLGHSGELVDRNLKDESKELERKETKKQDEVKELEGKEAKKQEEVIEKKRVEEEPLATEKESISNIEKQEIIEPPVIKEKSINNTFADAMTNSISEEVKTEVKQETQKATVTRTSSEYGEKSGCSYIIVPLLALLAFFLIIALITKFCFSALDNSATTDVATDNTELVDNDNGDSDSLDYNQSAEEPNNVYEGKTYEEVHNPSELIMLEDLKVVPDECVIITGSFKRNKNVLKMQRDLESLGYKTFTEVNMEGNLTRVGIIFDCQKENLKDYIHDIRRNIKGSKKAWYLIPRVHVD